MYKVFIDHKPIVILNKTNFSTNYSFVESKDIKVFPDDILEKINIASIEEPLAVLTDDVDEEFARLFKSYELVKAAGGVVQSDDGFLVIERNGFWDIPKGKMEKGELPEESAYREIEEECGISGHELDQLLTITYHTYEYKGNPVLKKTYWYHFLYNGSEKLEPQVEEGITKVEWFTKDRIPQIRSNTFGSINDVLDAYSLL
ncbi:MAG: NUDIX domain-containing protein [Crocinitomicaceae bacterium]|nr:NUDIX domain-containing protein [Crocinitomicaceae bacterium]